MVDVEILVMDDPNDLGRVTELTVRVTNPGPDPIDPTFAVPGNALANWYPWDVVSGPPALDAGASAAYHIRTPSYSAPDLPSDFRVIVRDRSDDSIGGKSEVTSAVVDRLRPGVTNPRFVDWEHSMIAPYELPFGWVPFVNLPRDGDFTIEGQQDNLTIRLDTGSGDVSEGMPVVAMRQRIHFPALFTVRFATEPDPEPQGIGGVLLEAPFGHERVYILHGEPQHLSYEITEWFGDRGIDLSAPGATHTETILFGDAGDGRTTRGEVETRVLFTNDTLTVDLVALFNAAGWPVPSKANIPVLDPQGAQDVGFGAQGVLLQHFEVLRPLEMKIFAMGLPGAADNEIDVSVAYAGGAALDQGGPWQPSDDTIRAVFPDARDPNAPAHDSVHEAAARAPADPGRPGTTHTPQGQGDQESPRHREATR